MPARLTLAGIASDLDALLDAAWASGGRITWGRGWLTGRHWVAVELHTGKVRVRRAKTRAEAAYLLLRDVYLDGPRDPWAVTA